MSDVEVEAESGLGGRLLTRGLGFGGLEKAPILVVFRTALPGVGNAEEGVDVELELAFKPAVVLRVGTAGVDCVFMGLGVGRPVDVRERVGVLLVGTEMSKDAEPGGVSSGVSGMSGSGFLVFVIGSAGSGPDGGAVNGGEGR